MGASCAGGGFARGGGKFCSMACWKGSSHGRIQNYCWGQVSENAMKKRGRVRTLAGSFMSIQTPSMSSPVVGL